MSANRGGARSGAGRKPKISKALKEAIALAIFQKWGGEQKAWLALIEKAERQDLRLLFEILRYWTDQTHGRAPQHIDIESGPDRLGELLDEFRKARKCG